MKRTDDPLVGMIGLLILGLHHRGELGDVNGNLSRVEILEYLDQFNDESFLNDLIDFIKETDDDDIFVEEN